MTEAAGTNWRMFCGDNLVFDAWRGADILLADPPYGINYKVRHRRRGLLPHETPAQAAIHGDDRPFDPTPFLVVERVALFGAEHFYSALPPGGTFFVWDKRRDSAPDDHPDCELIWLRGKRAARIHRQKWRGIVREGEENVSRSRKLHPNQKPVALLSWLLDALGAKLGETVADPFAGSGSTGVAALRNGLRFVGVEIDPVHFNTAVERLQKDIFA